MKCVRHKCFVGYSTLADGLDAGTDDTESRGANSWSALRVVYFFREVSKLWSRCQEAKEATHDGRLQLDVLFRKASRLGIALGSTTRYRNSREWFVVDKALRNSVGVVLYVQ